MFGFLLLVLVLDIGSAVLMGASLVQYGHSRSCERESLGSQTFVMFVLVMVLTTILVAGVAHQMK